ncbi:MAG: tRNA (adenosine(37)-N6)-threonylcarbamoyltransferase complex transferase subunit TsaD [Hyphomicrobiaceae bacterium]
MSEVRDCANQAAKQAQDCLILGIESSCDETAAAIVRRTASGEGQLLSNIVRSQWEEHKAFGGVVPELAARAHVVCLDDLIQDALRQADVAFDELDGVAASTGPGLVGGLIVGAITAKAISLARGIPFLSINHLEGHALTVGLTEKMAPPYMLLLVSGGHTQILLVRGVGQYDRISTTIDDALGEAFDKTAKLLGLPQPGGPSVEKAAQAGNAKRFAFPRPMKGRAEPHFSFAGLKTAVRQRAQATAPLSDQDVADLCASFEVAVCSSVIDRCRRAMELAEEKLPPEAPRRFVVAGGVAANQKLRASLQQLMDECGYTLHVPPGNLCTDNAAMIAWAGAERYVLGITDPFDAPVRPRWPLDPDAAPAIGAGVKA